MECERKGIKLLFFQIIISNFIQFSSGTWECYQYTNEDFSEIQNIGETEFCERNFGWKYTQGINTDYVGCGTCWCCKPVLPLTTEASTSFKTDDTNQKSTSITTSTGIGTITQQTQINTSNSCECTCPTNNELVSERDNLTNAEQKIYLEDALFQLQESIKIDKKNTTAYKNTIRSAHDNRKSSAIMGYTAALLITVPIVLIIWCDLLNVISKTNN